MKKLAAALILFCLAAAAAVHAAKKPNILVILVDDMGVMDTSVPFLADKGGRPVKHPLNRLYKTPNMEKLASLGTRFETFYANSVCSPTRVSIITGQSSARHHTTQWIRSESNNRGAQGPPDWKWEGITRGQQTLPGLLQKDGYHTIYVGKAHFAPFKAYGEFPDNFGFDVNIAGCSYGHPGSYYGKDGFGWIRGQKSRAVPGLKKYHGKDIFLTDALTEEMNAAITESVKQDKPFFAYMAYYAVHTPFMPNKAYSADYAGSKERNIVKAFATMIQGMDASVGKILRHLDTLGVTDNTLVLFLGDNGSDSPVGGDHAVGSSAPLRGKKATHYEGGMRVPFIAAWAKPDATSEVQKRLPIKAGALTREMGTIHDIFPTLLETAGTPYRGRIDGNNLKPVLSGGKIRGKRDFLMHFPHDHRSSYFTAYRLGDWKLIYHYTRPEGKRCELFNLANDPAEAKNLAKSKPRQLRRMFRAMTAALKDAGAQYPVSKTNPNTKLRPVLPR